MTRTRPALIGGALAATLLAATVAVSAPQSTSATTATGAGEAITFIKVAHATTGHVRSKAPKPSPRQTYMTATSSDGRVLPLRWNPCQKTITYKVNLSAVPSSSRPSVLKDVHAAFASAKSASKHTFTYRGTTTQIGPDTPAAKAAAEIIVAFVPDSKTVLDLSRPTDAVGGISAASVPYTTRSLALSHRGYVTVKTPDVIKRYGAGTGGGNTRRNLLAHEIAHVLGLDHVKYSEQIMYPALHSRSPKQYSHYGDAAGMKTIGKSPSCVLSNNTLRDLS